VITALLGLILLLEVRSAWDENTDAAGHGNLLASSGISHMFTMR
jgi:hypothetical protein